MNRSSRQKAVGSRQWAIANCKLQIANCKLSPTPGPRPPAPDPRPPAPGPRPPTPGPRPPAPGRPAFTLIELLVTVTIIGILAGLMLGGIRSVQDSAREDKTKATIAKLNHIIMEKYESYMTRRVPVDVSNLSPKDAATVRLAAIRYLMMMEMPERWGDVPTVDPNTGSISASSGSTITLPSSKQMPWTSLAIQYGQKLAAAKAKYPPNSNGEPEGLHSHAKCLYMIVAANPENLVQFGPSEIAIPDGDGLPVFVDGWGQPIYYLRWAPAFSTWEGVSNPNTWMPSDVQTGDPVLDHDPFDPSGADTAGFKLIPLIYSAGTQQAIRYRRRPSSELCRTKHLLGFRVQHAWPAQSGPKRHRHRRTC